MTLQSIISLEILQVCIGGAEVVFNLYPDTKSFTVLYRKEFLIINVNFIQQLLDERIIGQKIVAAQEIENLLSIRLENGVLIEMPIDEFGLTYMVT